MPAVAGAGAPAERASEAQAALARLQQGPTTIRELATEFGYGSEAAFSHAFKRVTGVPPGAVRHRSEHPAPIADGPVSHIPGDRPPAT